MTKKEWYEMNKEALKEKRRIRYQQIKNNPEEYQKIKDCSKKYRKEHREEIIKYSREYYAREKERLKNKNASAIKVKYFTKDEKEIIKKWLKRKLKILKYVYEKYGRFGGNLENYYIGFAKKIDNCNAGISYENIDELWNMMDNAKLYEGVIFTEQEMNFYEKISKLTNHIKLIEKENKNIENQLN